MALVKDLLLSFLSGSFSYLVDRLVILSRLCSFLARSKEEGKKDLEQASNYCLEMPFEKSTYNS